jgi:hypothetical protein
MVTSGSPRWAAGSPFAELRAGRLTGLSPTDAAKLASELRRTCLETGDARFCILRELVDRVAEWRTEHEEAGGVPGELLAEIDAALEAAVPAILDEGLSARASILAHELVERASLLLGGPSDWVRRGQASRHEPER